MKIGLHLSMLCEKWTDDTSIYLEELKEAGLSGVEVSLYGTTPDRLTKVFTKAKELGLDIYCGTGVDEAHDPSSSDPEIRSAALSYLESCIDVASQANAKAINGVLYAPWQAFSDLSRKVRWENSASVLRQAAQYAKEKNLLLHIEVINRFETDFMNTIEEGAQFLNLINHESVRLLVDTFHMNIEENNIENALTKYINKIGCIHVCENHRGVPGTGHIHWGELIKTLDSIGYDGYLEMETFTQAGTEVAKGMTIWRQNGEGSPLEEAKKGICFLKQQLKGEKNEPIQNYGEKAVRTV